MAFFDEKRYKMALKQGEHYDYFAKYSVFNQ